MISSSSGGSITAAFFVVAKAHFVSQNPIDPEDAFPFKEFMDLFYTPLKSFLESENVVNAILQDIGGTGKVIKFCIKISQNVLNSRQNKNLKLCCEI